MPENNPQLKPETIEKIMNDKDLIEYIQDIRAISHNTSLRLYEMSCLVDGILNFLRSKGHTNTTEMWNFINISTNIKEWHNQTGEYHNFEQFFERFYPDMTMDDLAKDRIKKTDFQKEIEAYVAQQKSKQN